ncbi:Uncharacterised protein [Brucella suis]|nr:Uncharacterised protein [Brucella suis]
MQVETHRNIVAPVCLGWAAIAAIEPVCALNDAAIMRQHDTALVIDAEQARIAVVAGNKALPPHFLDPVALHAVGPAMIGVPIMLERLALRLKRHEDYR